MHRQFLIKQVN